MGGGLLQLIATGAQDQYLTGSPQITFFSSTQKRYSNFSMESIAQEFLGTTNFGRKSTCSLSRNGDLVSSCMLEVKIPALLSMKVVYDKEVFAYHKDDVCVFKVSDGNSGFTYTLDSDDSTTLSTDDAGNSFYETLTVGDQGSVGEGDKARIEEGEHVGFYVKEAGNADIPVYWDARREKFYRGVSWVENLATSMVARVSINIGGQRVDSHTGEFLYLMSQLNMPASKHVGYDQMTRAVTHPAARHEGFTVMLPLRFWFNETNYGNALPLLALQYHEVQITVEFEDAHKLVVMDQERVGRVHCANPASNSDYDIPDLACFNAQLYANYIYLDTAERKKMATQHHEYLIQQVQYTGVETMSRTSISDRFQLNFNHPVKALVWVVQDCEETAPNTYVGEGAGGTPTEFLSEVRLLMNGHDRFSKRSSQYFSLYQPYAHWRSCPYKPGIYTYSFCLRCGDHAPSGTANFSRIDMAQLEVHRNTNVTPKGNLLVRIYAINYNVIRVMGGLGGVAYSS